jgi:hypothetical protein
LSYSLIFDHHKAPVLEIASRRGSNASVDHLGDRLIGHGVRLETAQRRCGMGSFEQSDFRHLSTSLKSILFGIPCPTVVLGGLNSMP